MRSLLRIQIENFLSFREVEITFADLSVLVGPNAAGKTNLLKLFKFLGETARTDLLPALQSFGGMSNVLFFGDRASNTLRIKLDAIVTKYATERAPDHYELSVTERNLNRHSRSSGSFVTRFEKFAFKRLSGPGRRITLNGGSVSVSVPSRDGAAAATQGAIQKIRVQPQSAGLATLRRLGQNVDAPQVDDLANLFERLRVFDVTVAAVRQPSMGEMTSELASDGSNIGCYLAWLQEEHKNIFASLVDDLRQIIPGLIDVHVKKIPDGYLVELEEGGLNRRISLRQASFGTVRSIALFAMLHDPAPPKLTCVEEIDHGLHPYALDIVVDRMRAASKKTQLVVATHSPALVNRLLPQELIVFERDSQTGATRVPRIDAEEIAKMEQESGLKLGELWFTGTIGGVL